MAHWANEAHYVKRRVQISLDWRTKLVKTPIAPNVGRSDAKLMAKTHVERMKLIKEDAESDAYKVDGMPLNGLSIGTNFGNIYAAIAALADTLQVLCERAGI